jgi:hypothetical protein
LEVERRRVVRHRADLGLAQPRYDRVALRRAADEEVIDVSRLVGRQLDQVAEAEFGVARGGLPPPARPLVEVLEEEPQERRLELVEPRVVADELEVALVA